MLVVYSAGLYKKYFETEYSAKIIIPDDICHGNFNIDVSQYKYIVGNDLFIFTSLRSDQECIDVVKLGMDWIMLEKYNIEAIVYAYNNWYIPSSPYMTIDKPLASYLLREIPPDAKYDKVKLLTGSRRFDQIDAEIKLASKMANFIGAIWPTCHYMSDTSYMWLIYSGRIRTIRQNETKPGQK
jgi:hypothetical protein